MRSLGASLILDLSPADRITVTSLRRPAAVAQVRPERADGASTGPPENLAAALHFRLVPAAWLR
ncbi:protein of unknown function [Rhodovastum atsumiense]|nr:protein of unknown function [Rhodovastum atsumiense]